MSRSTTKKYLFANEVYDLIVSHTNKNYLEIREEMLESSSE